MENSQLTPRLRTLVAHIRKKHCSGTQIAYVPQPLAGTLLLRTGV